MTETIITQATDKGISRVAVQTASEAAGMPSAPCPGCEGSGQHPTHACSPCPRCGGHKVVAT